MQSIWEWWHPLKQSLPEKEESAPEKMDEAQENVRAPTSQCKKRRSPERYTRYMALIGKCVCDRAIFL